MNQILNTYMPNMSVDAIFSQQRHLLAWIKLLAPYKRTLTAETTEPGAVNDENWVVIAAADQTYE